MSSIQGATTIRRGSWDITTEPEPTVIKSLAMPGFCLKVWRTDGRDAPMPPEDKRFILSHPFKKVGVTHLRNMWHAPPTSYDVTVETMPTVPELPEGPEAK